MTCLRAERSMTALGVPRMIGQTLGYYRILEKLDGGKGVAG